MAFKNIRVNGDGSDVVVITNNDTTEAVINGLVAYNTSGEDKSFTLLIDDVEVAKELVPEGGSYRLPDKMNVGVGTELKVNAPTDVGVTVSYLQQAIDPAASLTVAQQFAADAKADADRAENAVSNSNMIDEDDFASDSDTKSPTQQSVKAYIEANAGGGADLLDEDDMISNDDTKGATQQSIRTYVMNKVGGAMKYKGGYNAETNTPNLDDSPEVDTIIAGDVYNVTVTGEFYGSVLPVGTMLTSKVDDANQESDWLVDIPGDVASNYRDQFADGVYNGLEIPVPVDSLDGTLSAGLAYINGVRTPVVEETHTYTVSKDTYVDVNNGIVSYTEVDTDADAPAVNGLRVAKVVTDADYITTVTDLRPMTKGSDAKLADAIAGAALVSEATYGHKTVTETYTATDGQTEFAIANTVTEPITVLVEGFPLNTDEYDRDAEKITLHDEADENEQVHIIAHNG